MYWEEGAHSERNRTRCVTDLFNDSFLWNSVHTCLWAVVGSMYTHRAGAEYIQTDVAGNLNFRTSWRRSKICFQSIINTIERQRFYGNCVLGQHARHLTRTCVCARARLCVCVFVCVCLCVCSSQTQSSPLYPCSRLVHWQLNLDCRNLIYFKNHKWYRVSCESAAAFAWLRQNVVRDLAKIVALTPHTLVAQGLIH